MPLDGGYTGIAAYWKLDESSDQRNDSKSNNNLAQTGTVGSAAGKINNGASFDNNLANFLSIDNNAELATGDIDLSFTFWAKLNSKTNRQRLAEKIGGSSGAFEISYSASSDVFFVTFYGSSGFGGATTVQATNFGSPSTGVLYFIAVTYDAAADLLGISVNNGTPNTASHSGGAFDSADTIAIGHRTADPLDGMVDEFAYFKRLITVNEVSQLYGGGNGLAYGDFVAAGGYLLVKN